MLPVNLPNIIETAEARNKILEFKDAKKSEVLFLAGLSYIQRVPFRYKCLAKTKCN
jgi:hypothetical protein